MDITEEGEYTLCTAGFTFEDDEWVLDEDGFNAKLEAAFGFSDWVA